MSNKWHTVPIDTLADISGNIITNSLIDMRKYTSNYRTAKKSRPNMKTHGIAEYFRAAGILVLVTIILSSSIAYSFNDAAAHSLLWPKTADGQEEGLEEQDNGSNDENGSTISNINSSRLTLPELFSSVEKSVVQVAREGDTDISSDSRLGSGFVYDRDGRIVTNFHVITGSSPEGNIQVTFLDGSTYNARLIGGDPFSDLAVLQLEREDIPLDKLVPLPIGDSTALSVGEGVVAIGNPFGLSGSMTEGIISGLGRILPSAEQGEDPNKLPSDLLPSTGFLIPDIIQTDAPINPGNSGGPLLNEQGQVIGINTAIFSTTGASAGIGFAIPSNTIKKVIPSLITKGDYQHPYLGIIGVDISPEIADALGLEEARGFLVTDVSRGSPAEKAGIQGGNSPTNIDGSEITLGGDVILKIDGNTVRKLDDVLTYLEREKKVGDAVQLTLLRNGVTENTSLTLGPRPAAIESQGGLPQQEDIPPSQDGGQEQEQPPLTDQLYNRCLEVAGKDICDFMFQR